MNIQFTAQELLKRKEEFKINLKNELRKKLESQRNLALPVLRQLIAEFNQKAENQFEESFVDLDRTPIPASLKTDLVIEFIEEEFNRKGFKVTPITKIGRTFVRISWEHQLKTETVEELTLDSMIKQIIDVKISEALNNLKK